MSCAKFNSKFLDVDTKIEDAPPVEDTGPLQLFSAKTNLDPDGFCVETGKHWVYPINYPMRNYQLDMVSTALFNNTLVCLPTGMRLNFFNRDDE
jgi:hypothetical protein